MAKLKPESVRKRQQELEAARLLWEDLWREIADFMQVGRNDVRQKFTPGDKRNRHLLNNTATISSELLSGALHGLLTSPNNQWFELTLRKSGVVSEELSQNDAVKEWLQKSSRRMLDVFNNSNFQTEIHQFYLDLTTLCTGVTFVEEDPEFVVRFATKHVKDIYIAEDPMGRVSEVYRKFKWEAKKLVEEFGTDALPKEIIDFWKNGRTEKMEVLHAVYPDKVDPDGMDKKSTNFEFVSQWILLDRNNGAGAIELRSGGFNEMPYIVSRWKKYSGEMYGRGPGTTALPEAKIVNIITETIIKAAQKSVDPPLQAPDDGFINQVNTNPGGLTYYRSGTNDRLEPVFNNANLNVGFEHLEWHQRRIREAFFVDQLQLQQGPQMTATEVLQRTEEKMRLLGPLLGRQQHEFLRPLIDRVFGIMFRRGLFDEPPDELRGIDIDVQYSSSIARAQRAGELNNMLKTVEAIAPVSSFAPDALDNIDSDGFVKEIFRIQNFPNAAVRSVREVGEIREGRQQAQEELVQRQERQENVSQAQQLGTTAAQLAQTEQ